MSHSLASELQVLGNALLLKNTIGRAKDLLGPSMRPVPPAPSLDEYRTALAAMDWHYDRSDDYSRYCQGRDAYARLCVMAQRLDVSRTLWATYAP